MSDENTNEELDELSNEIEYLKRTINTLENMHDDSRSKCEELEKELEEEKTKYNSQKSEIIGMVHTECFKTYKLFREYYIDARISEIKNSGLDPLEAYYDIMDSGYISELLDIVTQTRLGIFSESYEHEHLEINTEVFFEVIRDTIEMLFDDLDETKSTEFLNSLFIDRNTFDIEDLLATIFLYERKIIDYDYILELPDKTRKLLCNVLIRTFYTDDSNMSDIVRNKVAQFNNVVPCLRSIRELFLLLWPEVESYRNGYTNEELTKINRSIYCAMTHIRGDARSQTMTSSLGVYLLKRNATSDELWVAFDQSYSDKMLSIYKQLSKDGEDEYIKRLPDSIRKKINLMKIKGDFK